MRRQLVTFLILVLTLVVAMVVAASQLPSQSGGFTVLHRAQLADVGSDEVVMGLVERVGESATGRHHHPGGEFGFVLSGTVVITTESSSVETLQAGDSFYQPPGEWHVVSTGAAGTRTVVFRVIRAGQPMVVPVE